jgi:ribonuclease P/MRP protein subunit RPP1
MYEAVTPHPDGEATAARFAHTLDGYGFTGAVVRARGAAPGLAAVRDRYDLDVVDAVEVVADDPAGASGAVGNYRPKRTLLVVRGGTVALNRFAVSQSRVDVLSGPTAGDGDVDHVLVRTAAENGVRLEFDLGPVLRESGGERVRELSDLRRLRDLVDHYDAPYVVTASPRSHLQVRAPRELRAVGATVGLGSDWVAAGLREWGRLADRNRERQSERFVEPGVTRGRYLDEGRPGDVPDAGGEGRPGDVSDAGGEGRPGDVSDAGGEETGRNGR